jgi:hypothetical protein
VSFADHLCQSKAAKNAKPNHQSAALLPGKPAAVQEGQGKVVSAGLKEKHQPEAPAKEKSALGLQV